MLASFESHRFGVIYILVGEPNEVKSFNSEMPAFFDSVALLRQNL